MESTAALTCSSANIAIRQTRDAGTRAPCNTRSQWAADLVAMISLSASAPAAWPRMRSRLLSLIRSVLPNTRHSLSASEAEPFWTVTRRVGAVMLEQNDEWSLNRRHMQLEGLQTLCDNVPTRLPAVAR